MTALRVLVPVAFVVWALTCSQESVTNGGTDTGNAAVGVLWHEDGTPGSGAAVRFYAAGADPRTAAAAATVTTDSDGRYGVSSLPAGAYNVLGTKDSARSFLDSVALTAHDTTHLPDDTLRVPGSVCGVVKLAGDTVAYIYVLALGTGTFATPDSQGNFCLSDMAPGAYDIRILTTLPGFGPKDTVLTVSRGATDTLADTILVNSSTIPVPTGLRLSYDTLKQIVTLTWDRADTGLVAGYDVYRQHEDSGLVKITPAPITDTTFSDSSATQDQTYTYRVKALDREGNEGLVSAGVGVEVLSAYSAVDTIIDLVADLGTFAQDSKGFLYVTNITSEKIEAFDSTGQKIREWATPSRLGSASRDNNLSINNEDDIYLYTYYDSVTVYDTLGNPVGGFSADINSCEGIAFLGDSILIADEQPDRLIKVYDSAGALLGSMNHDWGDGDLFSSLAVDSAGNVYLYGFLSQGTQSRSRIVDVLDRNGVYIESLFGRTDLPNGMFRIFGDSMVLTAADGIYCFTLNGELRFRFSTPVLARNAILLERGDVLVCFEQGVVVVYSQQ